MSKIKLAKKAIDKLSKIVRGRSRKAPKYGGGVESAGEIQKLSKGLKRNKNRRNQIKDVLGDGNPISRMDDSARRAFARRNLK